MCSGQLLCLINVLINLFYFHAPICSCYDEAGDDLEDVLTDVTGEMFDVPTQLLDNTQPEVTQMNYNSLESVSEVTVSDFVSLLRTEPSVWQWTWQCSVTRTEDSGAEDVVWTLSQSRCTTFMTFLVLPRCTWTLAQVKIFYQFGQKLTPQFLSHVLAVYLTVTWCPLTYVVTWCLMTNVLMSTLRTWCPGMILCDSVIRDIPWCWTLPWCQLPGQMLHGHHLQSQCQCVSDRVSDDGNICVSVQSSTLFITIVGVVDYSSVFSAYNSIYLNTRDSCCKVTEASHLNFIASVIWTRDSVTAHVISAGVMFMVISNDVKINVMMDSAKSYDVTVPVILFYCSIQFSVLRYWRFQLESNCVSSSSTSLVSSLEVSVLSTALVSALPITCLILGRVCVNISGTTCKFVNAYCRLPLMWLLRMPRAAAVRVPVLHASVLSRILRRRSFVKWILK